MTHFGSLCCLYSLLISKKQRETYENHYYKMKTTKCFDIIQCQNRNNKNFRIFSFSFVQQLLIVWHSKPSFSVRQEISFFYYTHVPTILFLSNGKTIFKDQKDIARSSSIYFLIIITAIMWLHMMQIKLFSNFLTTCC